MFDSITPLLLTYNEAPNIGRTLEKLTWAQRILVIDSGSTDDTLKILKRHAQVEIITRPFDSFAAQWNHGISLVDTPWVLSLDADYVLSDALIQELSRLRPSEAVGGFTAQFVYRVHGKRLRGSLYPPRIVLYRPHIASYVMVGHSQRVLLGGGKAMPLAGPIYHDDRKPLARWIDSQERYIRDEALHLLSSRRDQLNVPDRIRLMGWTAPVLVFFYTLFVKRCLLDGWAGWYYALQRVVAEALLALELMDQRRAGSGEAL